MRFFLYSTLSSSYIGFESSHALVVYGSVSSGSVIGVTSLLSLAAPRNYLLLGTLTPSGTQPVLTY